MKVKKRVKNLLKSVLNQLPYVKTQIIQTIPLAFNRPRQFLLSF